MKKILVTGGCGFIGSHIVDELLDNHYEVAVVDNLSTGKLENIPVEKVKMYNLDILDQNIYKVFSDFRPNIVIHQAAQVSVANSMVDFSDDANTNILGSLNIIEASKQVGVEKIIFASTAAVYGNPQYLPIDINHPINPMSPYGISKLAVEHYLKVAQEAFGINYSVLRYSNVYGPRQNAEGEGGVVAIFSEKLIKNESPTIFGDGKQTRDFIYVADVAKANVASITNGHNKILNVSTAEKIDVNELFALMKKVSNSDLHVTHAEERIGDIKHSVLENIETKTMLKWEPQMPLEQGLAETIAFYRGEGIKL